MHDPIPDDYDLSLLPHPAEAPAIPAAPPPVDVEGVLADLVADELAGRLDLGDLAGGE
jgi:hypothetical protein